MTFSVDDALVSALIALVAEDALLRGALITLLIEGAVCPFVSALITLVAEDAVCPLAMLWLAH